MGSVTVGNAAWVYAVSDERRGEGGGRGTMSKEEAMIDLIAALDEPDMFAATLRVARALDRAIESRSAEPPVLSKLRAVLSRPGALPYLRAQPRIAATDFLLWAAERLGIEG
ncbi:MAG TPA: hypothetical protein VKF37_12425 [Chloroflexota bacterium]|nr:hypothetical protein [Chloroflexota bacterium]